MYERDLRPENHSFFLFGPRGAGKTTWLKRHFGGAKWINLLDEALYQEYLRDISLFQKDVETAEPHQWVVVDEIQRLPSLLNYVHLAIENKRLRFALTGSSARKLKRTGVNLLAGRVLPRFLYPLTASELGSDFSLERMIRFGSLALIAGQENPERTLEAYVQMYLKEEVQAEALVRNLPSFARFLPIAGLLHAQVLNVSNVAREVGVKRPSADGFLQILEDTLIAKRLHAFLPKIRLREKSHPKFYILDSGLARALAGRVYENPSNEEFGHLLEGIVFMHLLSLREYFQKFQEIFYWGSADSDKVEVDFVLKKGDRLTAIEVKSQTQLPASKDLKGLRAIGEEPNVARRLCLYQGKREHVTEDGIEVRNVETFLANLPAWNPFEAP